ncbi:MAG: hypothetical protein Q9201_000037 [Fulgogasparrea decipioides]
MLEGEYHGMSEIYHTDPAIIPRPYGIGRLHHGNLTTYFLLSDFIEMCEELPDPVGLATKLVSLQQKSISPTGKFGFSTVTCHGKIPQHVAWDSSWTSFYTKLLRDALQRDFENNGPWPALEMVASRVLENVTPRLLDALVSDQRPVKPVLIHGDLWEGNIATERGTARILVIDAAAYYAHSEMEVGMWRCERHAIHDEKYKNAYLEQVPKDEPADEWDDRNRLYCIKMNVIHSAHHRGVRERQTYDLPHPQQPSRSGMRLTKSSVFEDMCYLIDKYAPYGFEESEQEGFVKAFSQAVERAKSH